MVEFRRWPRLPVIVDIDQELLDLALQVEAPVVDAGRLAERRSHVIHRETIADARAQERRRLVAGGLGNSAVPLERAH